MHTRNHPIQEAGLVLSYPWTRGQSGEWRRKQLFADEPRREARHKTRRGKKRREIARDSKKKMDGSSYPPTPLHLPACERLARLHSRRRASSSAASTVDSATSLYIQGVEEAGKAKDKEAERARARLREAAAEAHAAEQASRALSIELDVAKAALQSRDAEVSALREENDALQSNAASSRDIRRRYVVEVADNKRDRLAVTEAAARAALERDEGAAFAATLGRLAAAAAAAGARLHLEGAALRKQVKDMQIRTDGLVEMGRENLRLHASAAPPTPSPEGVAAAAEQAAQAAAMRRERNEAVGALRAERAAHAELLERHHAVEAARDSALRQLAEMPDVGQQIEQLSRARLGEPAWQRDRAQLEALLQQRTHELATMTRKREKARAEATRLKKAKAELQLQLQLAGGGGGGGGGRVVGGSGTVEPRCPSFPPAASRGDTPASWRSSSASAGASSSAAAAAAAAAQQAAAAQDVVAQATKDAEVAFLRSRVRELTHQGRYAAGFATPPPHSIPVAP